MEPGKYKGYVLMERICPIIKECPDKIACCYMDYTICSKRPDLTKEDVEFAYWDY